MSLFVARLLGAKLSNSFERVAIGRDFEHRNSHVALDPFPIVQLDDCFTRDEFALRVDDLPFSSRRIHRGPKFSDQFNLRNDFQRILVTFNRKSHFSPLPPA